MAEDRRAAGWWLPLCMLLGAAAGLGLGGALGPRWGEPGLEPLVLTVRALGTIFLAALKALVVPLVVASVTVSVARMGDLRRVGRLAGMTTLYFLVTTALAVATGMVLVNALAPGRRVGGLALGALSGEQAARVGASTAQALYDVVTGMVPANLVAAAADGNVLGLIVASVAFGAALAGGGARVLIEVLEAAEHALLALVHVVVRAAPVGIFGLVADRVGRAGGGEVVWHDVQALGWYAGTVLAGLGLHALVTLPLFLLLFARRRPAPFLAGMSDSLLTAFGTASSAAAMGVTIDCVTERNGVSARAARFVVPLGTTINMNGTALYEAVAVLFIAQKLGVALGMAQQLVVLVTATLAAVGAAAIPEAGLVTMVLVLGAVGLPADGIGLILSIDWVLDRFRTAVNVLGDAVGAAVIDRRLPPDPGLSSPDATG